MMNFTGRLVNTVFENTDKFQECFEIIENEKEERRECGKKLITFTFIAGEEFSFVYLFPHNIMLHVDILFDKIQS